MDFTFGKQNYVGYVVHSPSRWLVYELTATLTKNARKVFLETFWWTMMFDFTAGWISVSPPDTLIHTLNRKRFDTNGKHAKLCLYIEVSIDGGTRKGMVYRGKSSINGWFRGSPIYGNPHIDHSPIKTSMTAFPLCHISNETGEKLDVLLFPRGVVINLYGFTCCRRNPIDDHGMTIAQQTTYLIRWKILPDDLH